MAGNETDRVRVAILVADDSEVAVAERELLKTSDRSEITSYDGVLTGWTTQAGLNELRGLGLMVKISATPAAGSANKSKLFLRSDDRTTAEIGQAMPAGMSATRESAPLGTAPQPFSAAGTFVIEVTGPMRPAWRKGLASQGVEILERAGPYSWLVSGDMTELAKISSQDWIRDIRLSKDEPVSPAAIEETETVTELDGATREMTFFPEAADPDSFAQHEKSACAASVTGKPTCYDAYLYRPESLEKVRAIIEDANLTMVEETAMALRFHGPGAGEVAKQLKTLPEVRYAGEYHPPRLDCAAGLATIGWHKVNPDPASPRWSGEGEVIGIADSGVDLDHPDLKEAIDGVLGFPGALPQDSHGHGTHVCGIAVGRGKSVVTGVAPKAKAVVRVVLGNDRSFVLPLNYDEVFQPMVDANARVLNLSWGWALGGDYDQGSWQVDTYARAHPEVLMVVSAGNFGRSEPGGSHVVRSLGAPASSKNVITVGASTLQCPRPVKADGSPECTQCSLNWGTFRPVAIRHAPASQEPLCGPPIAVAGISSRGPTEFQSIKPDLLAPGVLVESARSRHTPGPQLIFEEGCPVKDANFSACATGTSMAAPFVSGAAVVLRQWLRQHVGIPEPSAALLKACLISCASRLSIAGTRSPGYPDFDQGYGLLDLSRLFNAVGDAGVGFICADVANDSAKGLASRMDPTAVIKSQHLIRFQVPPGASGPLRVCLTWTDLPGKHLQNNLQLDLQIPGGTFKLGNEELLFGADPFDPSAGDLHNNVEVIDLPSPAPGLYRARVFAESTLFPNPAGANPLTTTLGSQGFGLTIMGPVVSVPSSPGGLSTYAAPGNDKVIDPIA